MLQIAAKIFTSSYSKFVFLLVLRGGEHSHEVFPCFLGCIKQHFLLYFLLYLGNLWSCYQGPQFSKLGFRGGVRIINPPLTILSIRLYLPNLGTLIKYLGPLGIMGPHVPVTRVWGTLLEVKCHLLHHPCISLGAS